MSTCTVLLLVESDTDWIWRERELKNEKRIVAVVFLIGKLSNKILTNSSFRKTVISANMNTIKFIDTETSEKKINKDL